MILRTTKKEVILAALIGIMAAWMPSSASAQLTLPSLPGLSGGGATQIIPPLPASPGFAVSDQAVEVNTFDAAISLTTGGGGGVYAPNASFISGQDQVLFSGVTSESFGPSALFTGWLPCKPDCTDPAQTIVLSVLQTYQSAIAVAQQQEQELEGEDFSPISQNSTTSLSVLPVLQDIVDSNLVVAQELQYVRQELAVLIEVQSTRNATDLNFFAVDRANSQTSALPLLADGQ